MEEIVARGHPVWAEIDLGAIKHNIAALARLSGGAEVMGVVKGYAYGHGNPESARAILDAGATRLGVARVAEALHLREAGVSAPIHVFSEPPPQAAARFVEQDLIATVYTEAFGRAVSDAAEAAGRRATVHVKIDTGMHRVGVPADDVPDAIRTLVALPGLEVEGVWSHLAVADIPDHPFTRRQLELFSEVTEKVGSSGLRLRYRHIANSAATLTLPETHLDMVRCGVAAYGLWPGGHPIGTVDLKPALALRARVGMAKEVAAGEALSYGLNYELSKTGRVVTVAGGYADGYDRRLSGRADVLIRGQRYRVSGTVCMDQFMVDVGELDADPGEVVTLIGSDGTGTVTAEELAEQIGTINYEVTSRIPSRVPRIFKDPDG